MNPSPSGLPRGTVTFFFSDMEGSTRLLKALRARYPEVLAGHRRIVRAALAAHDGHEVGTEGDSFFVAFTSAHDAVRCALDIQRGMAAAEWPDDHEVRVRIGLHTGQATVDDEGYTGLAVHRAARISAKATGGQVLISQTTRAILEDEEDDPGFVCLDVGEHELKDFDRPVRLFEVRKSAAEMVVPSASRGSPPSVTPIARPSSPRIVVLPFANISPDPDDYFADGMTEDLIEKLAHVPGLRVIARTTAMHYKESTATALEIGRELNVSLVLECSVRKAGNRVRITSQLIDTNSEEHLWASRYDRELDDIFAIQDDISEQIASALTDHVAGFGSVPLPTGEGQQDTTDMDAYTQFLQARELVRKRTSEPTIRQALDLFEGVVARDPGFARARVGAAECYLWLATEGALPLTSSEKRAREEIEAALAKNEALAEAHSVLASLLLGEDDLAGSAREAHRAIELNPSFSDPYRWLAQIEAGRGRIDETVRLLEDAYKIDPLDVNVIAFLGRAYFYAGRIEKALGHWDKHLSLAEFRVNAQLTEYHLGCREYSKAEECLHEMERLRPGSVWVLTYRGVLAAREGETETARRCIDSLDELGREGALTCWHIGFVHFALDELDAFWECMDQALALHALPLLELLYSPLFSGARDDPRYDDLIRRQREMSWTSEA